VRRAQAVWTATLPDLGRSYMAASP